MKEEEEEREGVGREAEKGAGGAKGRPKEAKGKLKGGAEAEEKRTEAQERSAFLERERKLRRINFLSKEAVWSFEGA